MPVRSRRRRPPVSKSSLKKMMKSVAYSTQETKHHRVTIDEGAIPDAGSALELNSVDSQGVASGQFVGQEIRQMGLRLRGSLKQADSSNIVRWLVVQFSESFSELLATQTSQFVDMFYDTSLPLYSPIRESSIAKVYLDRTVVLNQADGANNKISLFNKWIPLGFKRYTADEANLGGVGRGSDKIYLVSFSDSGVSPHPTITCSSTLYFKDA